MLFNILCIYFYVSHAGCNELKIRRLYNDESVINFARCKLLKISVIQMLCRI